MSVLEIAEINLGWDWSVLDGSLAMAPTLAFAICIVGHLFGDIMNMRKWLNNSFAILVKRLIFFAVVLAALFAGADWATGAVGSIIASSSPFAVGLSISTMYTPAFALLAYVYGYIRFSSSLRQLSFSFR